MADPDQSSSPSISTRSLKRSRNFFTATTMAADSALHNEVDHNPLGHVPDVVGLLSGPWMPLDFDALQALHQLPSQRR